MKKYFYITILAFLILGMLFEAIPARAGATKTPVSGLLTLIGDSDEQPNLRVWWAGHNGSVLHWKNGVALWKWESTDTRLGGYSIYEFDSNVHWSAEGAIKALTQIAKETVYTNDDYTEPIWSCQFVSTYNVGLKEDCQGVGKYKGLKAFLELDAETGTLFEGYILDPGGE